MRNFLAGLLACFVVLCAGYALADYARASPRPAGSRVVGKICFDRATPRGWVPAQLRNANGDLPIRGTVIEGDWYFPSNAGRIRMWSCP